MPYISSKPRGPIKFRDDIDPENTWIVSDTHFGHDNIVGFCHRPEDHEQVMIAEWRAHVPDDATVLHLGDISYGHKGGNTRFKRLTSKELTGKRKLIIQGNHDNQGYSFYRDSGFSIVSPFMLGFTYGADGGLALNSLAGRNTPGEEGHLVSDFVVSFSHYAWSEPDDPGAMPYNHTRVHGHIHNNGYTRDAFVPFLKNHLNVSVEQMKYRPVNMKLLLDGALLGHYPETTAEQVEDARRRKAIAMSRDKPA